MKRIRVLVKPQLLAALALATACTGPLGDPGKDGPEGTQGPSSLVRFDPEAAGARCANGGLAVKAGLDANGNGVLDDAEIDAAQTAYVCTGVTGGQGGHGPSGTDGNAGAPGTDGSQTVVRVTPEPPGANCPLGGQRIEAGIDLNGNTVLENDEVTTTGYVCESSSFATFFFGDLVISSADDLARAHPYEVVVGNLILSASLSGEISLPSLRQVSGDIASFRGRATGITRLDLPSLTHLGGRLTANGWRQLVAISAPALVELGSLQVWRNPLLTTLSLPALKKAANVSVTVNPALPHCGLLALVGRLLSGRSAFRYVLVGNLQTDQCTTDQACPAIDVPGIADHFRLCLELTDWSHGKSACEALAGGSLAWFRSADEWAAFRTATAGKLATRRWMGFTDAALEGSWLSASPVAGFTPANGDPTVWAAGEPSGGTQSNCAYLDGSAYLGAYPCTSSSFVSVCRLSP